MTDLIRHHPVSSLLAIALIVLMAVLAFAVGCWVLVWILRAIVWLVPKLDALALSALRCLFGGPV